MNSRNSWFYIMNISVVTISVGENEPSLFFLVDVHPRKFCKIWKSAIIIVINDIHHEWDITITNPSGEKICLFLIVLSIFANGRGVEVWNSRNLRKIIFSEFGSETFFFPSPPMRDINYIAHIPTRLRSVDSPEHFPVAIRLGSRSFRPPLASGANFS